MSHAITSRNLFRKIRLVRISTASVFLFLQPPVFSQAIQWGVKGGTPLNAYFRTTASAVQQAGYFSHVNRYTLGPAFQIELPFRLALEFELLYKRQHFTGFSASSTRGPLFPTDVFNNQKTTANVLDVPVSLKYPLSDRPTHLFVLWGGSVRHLSNIRQVVTTTRFPGPTYETMTTNKPPELRERSNAGFVMGTGIEFRTGFARISPEFRSTYWAFRTFRSFTSASPNGLLDTSQNEMEFLLTVWF